MLKYGYSLKQDLKYVNGNSVNEVLVMIETPNKHRWGLSVPKATATMISQRIIPCLYHLLTSNKSLTGAVSK
jgi:hypothetical protein